jgi:hypothetical protein
MAYHFKQLSYASLGYTDNLTSDKFWLEFVKFMCSSPANGGPGWTLKAYGLGLNNSTGAVKSFQINGNFDPNTVFSDGTVFTGTANSISACGLWFILKEPATNRNYQREFLFHRSNQSTYLGADFTTYANYMGSMSIFYSCQGFLTSSSGNGFNAADVTGVNPPIAYDMVRMTGTSHRNPQDGSWAYVSSVANGHVRSNFTQKDTGVYQSTPWQYIVCAADNTDSEGYGWYIMIYVKSLMAPIKFFCYDPLKSGTYDSSMLDPVMILNEATDITAGGSATNIFTAADGGLLNISGEYNNVYSYNHRFCWAKRPASFSSKSDVTTQTGTSYSAQVCRANCFVSGSGPIGTVPNGVSGKGTIVPMPYTLGSSIAGGTYYPGLPANAIAWIGQSSMLWLNHQRNLGNLQTVNKTGLRSHISIQGGAITVWNGSIPVI